jgi:hypothetical protein
VDLSLKEICNCIGFSGNISLVKDFFGYQNAPGTLKIPGTNTIMDPLPLPRELSLRKQAELLKACPYIRVHLKLVDSSWLTPFTFGSGPSVDQLVNAMRELYGAYGIGVVVKSTEMLENVGDLKNLEIGECITAAGPFFGTTDEQDELFANHNGVPYIDTNEAESGPYTREIVIYFVWATDPPKNGCATYPSGSPGAVVVYGCDLYTLSHEVGHVLDLGHVSNSDRLMYGDGRRTNPPPNLTGEEIEDMKESVFMFEKC